MARAEITEETRALAEKAAPADWLIGVAGPANTAELKLKLDALALELASGAAAPRIVVACQGAAGLQDGEEEHSGPVTILDLPAPAIEDGVNPWAAASQSSMQVLALAQTLNPQVSMVLGADLAALNAATLERLSYPVLEKHCDLVMPVYPAAKFEGLINSSILSPLNRALYGSRMRFPLAPDYSCSVRMATMIAQGGGNAQATMWPATLGAISGSQLCQVHVDFQHAAQTDGLELSAVLAQLAGSAFQEMEQHAAHWQRVRGSQPAQTWGSVSVRPDSSGPIDVSPMIDSFMLASRNLLELWGLVLPPVTLLELKHLSRMPAAQFRMTDELWVRIIYDFALAHRLRTMSRVHLLGALTPLYLAWVASYVQEAAAMPALAAEQRLEQLARAYESGKPYLVSRWRWPDRFNP